MNIIVYQSNTYVLDTMELARHVVRQIDCTIPDNYKLSTLQYYVTNEDVSDKAHRAMADVEATVKVLKFNPFWENRVNIFILSTKEDLYKYKIQGCY